MHKEIGHHVAMKFRLMAGLALSALIFISATPASNADSTPSPSPSPSPSSTPLTAIEQYKLDLEIYRTQVAARKLVREEIAKEFMAKVEAANSFAEKALLKAKTKSEIRSINTQQKTAIALAIAIKEAALSNMGPLPLEPVKPSKPESSKSGKPESSKSPEATAAKKTKSPKASPSSSS